MIVCLLCCGLVGRPAVSFENTVSHLNNSHASRFKVGKIKEIR